MSGYFEKTSIGVLLHFFGPHHLIAPPKVIFLKAPLK